jgi:hypothetical protein
MGASQVQIAPNGGLVYRQERQEPSAPNCVDLHCGAEDNSKIGDPESAFLRG